MRPIDHIVAANLGAGAALDRTRPLDLPAAVLALERARAELLESRRLASLGEMAGRTAHEVLNPVTAARGRIHRLMDAHTLEFDHALEVLATVIEAWVNALEREGPTGFYAEMTAPDPSGRSMLENDLDAAAAVAETLARVRTEFGESLVFLLSELDRVTVIVDGMRNLARSKPKYAPVDVDGVVAEAARIVEDTANRSNVWVQFDCANVGEVLGDRFEILQILTNLARNGIQAISEAHAHRGGTLRLSTHLDAGRILVRVSDDGTGIHDDFLDKVFLSGFTTRAGREGSGLGLGIARRLARSMGGDLSVERTAERGGTTFLLELPPASVDRPANAS